QRHPVPAKLELVATGQDALDFVEFPFDVVVDTDHPAQRFPRSQPSDPPFDRSLVPSQRIAKPPEFLSSGDRRRHLAEVPVSFQQLVEVDELPLDVADLPAQRQRRLKGGDRRRDTAGPGQELTKMTSDERLKASRLPLQAGGPLDQTASL